MGSLSALYDLTRGALSADQAAVNATANNVANQNTAGYTRQVVSWQSGDTVTLSAGAQSSSAPEASVASARDRVLEHRLQTQTQLQSGTGARSGVLAQLESVFSLNASNASSGSTELGTSLDKFFNSLSSLSVSPTDAAAQNAVLGAAATLAASFNSASAQLAAVQTGINGEIANTVPAINALTATIAGLNAQIARADPNSDAGALEDQRQLAITKLSSFVGIDQIRTEHNGITLTTQGGALLVEGSTSVTLAAAATGAGATSITDSSGIDITTSLEGGSVGGLLAAQSTDLPAVTSALDALAFRVASAVNTQNAAGATPSGTAGAAIFTLTSSVVGSAASIAVGGSAAVASAALGDGAAGNGNLNALADLANARDSSGNTFSGQLAAMLAGVGTSSAQVREQNAAEQASVTQLTTQRDSLSVVSLDQEASNLSLYQRSYEAGAKLLATLDALMAAAINLGTPTTVA